METLGDYKLVKVIGQGALGTVYLAEHRLMKKTFALKVMPADLCKDRAFIQRFEEEIGNLSSIEHPHLVSIHNISYDQGVYFLVCDCIVDEFGETTNLDHYLSGNKSGLEEEEAYQFARQIASALDHLHSAYSGEEQFVHRALKPSNVLISQVEGTRVAVLSDCGLSRILGTGPFISRTYKALSDGLGASAQYGEISADLKKLTPVHDSFLRSFQFLAPEQKTFDPKRTIDEKVDVYSFGMIVYMMLTGSAAEGYVELPSVVRPHLRYSWDDLTRSCLQRDPARRPVSLSSLVERLSQAVVKETVQVRELPESEKARGEGLRPIIRTMQLERPIHDPDPAAMFMQEMSVKNYVPERKKEEGSTEPLLTEMVVVAGGSFYRGSRDGNRDEMPVHQVTLENFAIDIHQVTNDQFIRFLQAMQGIKDCNHNDMIRLKDSRINNVSGKFSIESGYVKHPVVGVTWYGAVAFAKWVGKRLPTEAEWEVASRGGIESAVYPTGETIEKTQANFFSADTTAVMSYAPNGYGLYDMAGNVYEWCQDWYGFNYYETSMQEPIAPKGPPQGVYRVLRGGCWKSSEQDLRCSNRHRNNPRAVDGTYGFRCAADVK